MPLSKTGAAIEDRFVQVKIDHQRQMIAGPLGQLGADDMGLPQVRNSPRVKALSSEPIGK